MYRGPIDSKVSWSAERVRAGASQLAALEQSDPNSAATAWFTLEYAIALESNGRFKDARPVLERVLAFPPAVLPEHDPVRDVATLHLAALLRVAGEPAAADANVKAAGITRAQCTLFDVHPVATDTSVSTADFPEKELRWGFDGFSRESFEYRLCRARRECSYNNCLPTVSFSVRGRANGRAFSLSCTSRRRRCGWV